MQLETTSEGFVVSILQYTDALNVFGVSQNKYKGLILSGYFSRGSIVCVPAMVSYKMQNVILTGEDLPSNRWQKIKMSIGYKI